MPNSACRNIRLAVGGGQAASASGP
jgi:hypothetical protein